MSVRKTKFNTYTVDCYDSSGKRISKTFKRKKDAEAFEIKIKNEKIQNKMSKLGLKRTEIDFNEALDNFYNTKIINLSAASKKKYKNIINQFKGFVNNLNIRYVSDFTTQHADELLKKLSEGVIDKKTNQQIKPNPKTVNAYLTLIKSFFKEQVVKGNLERSPMLHIKNLKEDKNQASFYSEDELKAFFNQNMDYSYRLAFMGLLYTGMRISELINVEWSDLDFDNKIIKVQNKANFKVKTDNSIRDIPIPDVLLEELRIAAKNKKSSNYVFTSVEGYKINPKHLLDTCKKIAKKAGIESKANLHKFRHTYASYLIKKNVSSERIQKLLGHSSINQTLNYAHLKTNDLLEDVNLLNNVIEKAT